MFHSAIRIVVASLLGGLLAVSSGCISATDADNKSGVKQARTGEKVRCRREYPTGSHIPQMVCHRVRHIDDRRRSDQQKMRNLQLGGAIAPPPQNN